MKKTALVLALIGLILLVGCGNGEEKETNQPTRIESPDWNSQREDTTAPKSPETSEADLTVNEVKSPDGKQILRAEGMVLSLTDNTYGSNVSSISRLDGYSDVFSSASHAGPLKNAVWFSKSRIRIECANGAYEMLFNGSRWEVIDAEDDLPAEDNGNIWTATPSGKKYKLDINNYALPTDDSVVTEGYRCSFSSAGNDGSSVCAISVPLLTSEKPNASAWNTYIAQKIFSKYAKTVAAMSENVFGISVTVRYEYDFSGEVCIILIYDMNKTDGADHENESYYIYYYDMEKDKFLSSNEMSEVLFGEKGYMDKLIKALNDSGLVMSEDSNVHTITADKVYGIVPASDGGIDLFYEGYDDGRSKAATVHITRDMKVYRAYQGDLAPDKGDYIRYELFGKAYAAVDPDDKKSDEGEGQFENELELYKYGAGSVEFPNSANPGVIDSLDELSLLGIENDSFIAQMAIAYQNGDLEALENLGVSECYVPGGNRRFLIYSSENEKNWVFDYFDAAVFDWFTIEVGK